MIKSAIACMLDINHLQTIYPLLEKGEIDAIEWSFDAIEFDDTPPWYQNLLKAFSVAGNLIGHGIFYSLFTGKWSKDQSDWLNRLSTICDRLNFDHISEHFGFMTGADFHKGAPFPVPFSHNVLLLGQDRLKRLQDACKKPVGLENLAYAFSKEDVLKQSEFLAKLLEPVNGFLILDLHNVYCQCQNFSLDPMELLNQMPLNLVKEIHISGGSWQSSNYFDGRSVRRDTHDHEVPEAVFEMLTSVVAKCPNVQYCVLEQMGWSLASEAAKSQFRADFWTMKKIISNDSHQKTICSFDPVEQIIEPVPVEDIRLYEQQRLLSQWLVSIDHPEQFLEQLSGSSLFQDDAWNWNSWRPYMIDTGIQLAKKWQ